MAGKLLGAALVAAWGVAGLTGGLALAQVSDQQLDTADAANAARQNQPTHADTDQSRNMTDRQSDAQQSRSGNQQQSWDDQQQSSNDSDRNRNQADDHQADNRNESRRGRDQRDWQSQIRFGDASDRGLEIVSVEQGTPYYRGGLRQGDVIVTWNNRQIRNQNDFGRWAEYRAGQRIPVTVLRDGRRETVNITYDQDRNRQSYEATQSYGQQSYQSQAFLGVRFETRGRGGAVISDVVSGSPADQAGLKAGDEIVAVNDREVNSGREVTRVVSSLQPGDRIDIEFSRRIENRTQAVLESRQGDVASARYDRSSDPNRQGGQYDGIEQSSYDQETQTRAEGEYNSGQRTADDYSNRSSGRRLLPRLRN